MPRHPPLPVELVGAPFRTSDVDGLGVPRGRLESADVLRVHHGVRAAVAPANLVKRAEALALILRPNDAFSHTTAARLWGAPVPRAHEVRLHVTTAGADVHTRRPGVTGHRAASLPVTMLGGLPVVEAAHVFVQCATILGHDDLVAVGDYLVTPRRIARKPAIVSLEALGAAIPARLRGAGRARRALADVRIGAESPMETRTRLLLLRSGLPEPTLNPEIAGYHPDLFYPQWRLAIEYLGDQHRTDPKEWGRDIRRREAFENAGHRVVLVTRYDILAEPHQFLARVAHAIAQQQHR